MNYVFGPKMENCFIQGSKGVDTVLWGVDWISDSQKIVTVTFAGGNIQLWNEKAELLKTIN